MAITAWTGPLVSFGTTLSSTGRSMEYNGQMGPGLSYAGMGLLDPRAYYTYKPGSPVTTAVYGWYGLDRCPVIDAVPTVISTNSVAQTQSSTTAGAARTLTLTASDTNNVTISQSVVAPETGVTVTGLLAIDGVAGTTTFGSDATITVWASSTMISRALTITSTVDDSGGVYTISGRDVYGYLMNEVIVGPNNGTVTTQKAFKYISTITCSGTINSTGVYVGVSDLYGLPIFAPRLPYIQAYIDNALITNSTGLIGGSTRATQTSTTPDVRGTLSSTTASDGTRRLTIFQTPQVINLSSAANMLVGAAQYSTA